MWMCTLGICACGAGVLCVWMEKHVYKLRFTKGKKGRKTNPKNPYQTLIHHTTDIYSIINIFLQD